MKTSIQKWGNSQGIRIPKTIIDELQWKENEELRINVKNGKIVIEKIYERKNIKQLFKDYKGKYQPINIDWGEKVGEEIW